MESSKTGMPTLVRALVRTAVAVVLLGGAPPRLAGQAGATPVDRARVLLVERRFDSDTAERAVVTLERGVVYRAEVEGAGTPVFEHLRRGAPSAFLVPVAGGAADGTRYFEVYAVRAGPHAARLTGLAPGVAGTLRLYRDAASTADIAARHDRAFALGMVLAAGRHSGYRLDPTGGADPRGGADYEGCLLGEAAGRFGTCVGIAVQDFPDAGFRVTWGFLEERIRVVTGHLLTDRRTDLGVSVRYSAALAAGPRNLHADLLSLGICVTQHLAGESRRRGWALVAAWQHGRLGYAPETELLDTDRFTAGLAWLP